MYGCRQRGVSLVELLVALAAGATVLAGLYGMFVQQQRVYSLQEQLIEMQQNVRLGMDVMVSDIRMGGFDPTGRAGAKIAVAQADMFRFTMDTDDNDPTTLDDIAYGLDTVDHELTRAINGSGRQPVVNNIISLKFCYFLDGNPDCVPNPPATELDLIRSVQVDLTARTSIPDPRYRHPVHKDHYRTATLTSLVRLRNVGLNRG